MCSFTSPPSSAPACRNLNEGQKLSFDIEADRRSGKSAATNLQAV